MVTPHFGNTQKNKCFFLKITSLIYNEWNVNCRDKNIIIIIPSLTVPLAALPRAVSSCRDLRRRISIQNQERLYNHHVHDDDYHEDFDDEYDVIADYRDADFDICAPDDMNVHRSFEGVNGQRRVGRGQ